MTEPKTTDHAYAPSVLAAEIMRRARANAKPEYAKILPEGEIETVSPCRILNAAGNLQEVVTERQRPKPRGFAQYPETERKPPSLPPLPSTAMRKVPKPKQERVAAPVAVKAPIGEIIRLLEKGRNVLAIAAELGCSEMTVYDRIRRYRDEHGQESITVPTRRSMAAAKSKRRGGGRGKNWARLPITAEQVIEGQRAGKSVRQVAEECGVAEQVARERLTAARRSPEFCEMEQQLRTCGCGGRKYAHVPKCAKCQAAR